MHTSSREYTPIIACCVMLSMLHCGQLAEPLVDGGVDASDASSTADTFACGTNACIAKKQMCQIVYAQVASYVCVNADDGPFDCDGAPTLADAAGSCGCFESSSGNVTVAKCVP